MFDTSFYDLACESCKAEIQKRGLQAGICPTCKDAFLALAQRIASRVIDNESWTIDDILNSVG